MKELLKQATVQVSEDKRRDNLQNIYGKVGTSALIKRADNALKDHSVYRDIEFLLESLGKTIIIVDKNE